MKVIITAIANIFKRQKNKNFDITDTEIQKKDLIYLNGVKDKIEALDLRKVNIDDIIPYIRLLIKGQPMMASKVFNPTYVYRCIVYKEKPTQFSQIIYPPKHLTRKNRANRDGNSMFYGSLNKVVGMIEVGAKIGDFVALGKWNMVKTITVTNAGYHKGNLAERKNVPGWAVFKNQEFNSEKKDFVWEYIGEKFSQKIEDSFEKLNLTNAIAEYLLDDRFEGLFYPSVAINYLNDNIVLKPSVIDSGSLKLKYVLWVKILDIINDNEYTYEYIDICTNIGRDGYLNWEQRPPQWKDLPNGWYFDEVDKERVVRDPLGKIIDFS
ncbi:MAG: hypothetical protein JWR50_1852 [Mucilaginibacter sp.]|nr:hypothetical protein [Mucilaginibacter sp.]